MHRITIRTATVLGVLAIAAPALANHAWADYHWGRTIDPLPLELGSNVSSVWSSYLSGASADWNLSSVLNTSIKSGNTNATKGRNTPKNCVPTSGRVEVCSAKYGSTGWLGVAQIWIDSADHITQGTAKMNDTYFSTRTYDTPAWRRLVMCQEVAHTFGLDHQDENFSNVNLGTCMDYTNAPAGGVVNGFDYGPSNEHPNQHDYDELGIIYSHLDSYNTYITTSADGGGGGGGHGRNHASGPTFDPATASEWGRAVHFDSAGHPNIFEKDLGGGNRLLTHVFWAD